MQGRLKAEGVLEGGSRSNLSWAWKTHRALPGLQRYLQGILWCDAKTPALHGFPPALDKSTHFPSCRNVNSQLSPSSGTAFGGRQLLCLRLCILPRKCAGKACLWVGSQSPSPRMARKGYPSLKDDQGPLLQLHCTSASLSA